MPRDESTTAEISLSAALARAQANMTNAAKDSHNPHFKRTYADLASVRAACLPALSAEGIAVTQPVVQVGEGWGVETRLTLGAQSERCVIPLIFSKNDMQGLGSALTYARRYGLMCMAMVAPDDDDGQGAGGEVMQQRQEPPRQASNHEPVKIEEIRNRIKADLEGAATVAVLQEVWRQAQAAMSSLPEPMRLELTAAKDKRKGELTPISQTIPEDEIPY